MKRKMNIIKMTLSVTTIIILSMGTPVYSSITVSPSCGTVGTVVTVEGNGYNGSEAVRIDFGETLSITTTESSIEGTFSTAFIVDVQSGGTTTITVVGESSHLSATGLFTILAQITLVSPTAGTVGTVVTVEGNGYGGNEVVRIDFGETLSITTAESSSDGIFSTIFIVDLQPGGTTTITAVGGTSSLNATGSFTILAQITLTSPTAGTVGTVVTVEGNGYGGNEVVRIDFGETPSITITASSIEGTFSTAFIVDVQSGGTTTITAAGETLRSSITGIFTILAQILVITPTTGTVGTVVTIGGNGYGSSEAIQINFGKTLSITTAVSSPKGTFSTTFTVDSQSIGTTTITAVGKISHLSATGVFTITPRIPSDSISNFSATPGDQQVMLKWVIPTNGTITDTGGIIIGALIIRSVGRLSDWTPDNGTYYGVGSMTETGTTVIYVGSGTTYTDTGLTNGNTYYYGAFAYDSGPNYSIGTYTSTSPQDIIPPESVTNFTAYSKDNTVVLNWDPPGDLDYTGVMIVQGTSTITAHPLNKKTYMVGEVIGNDTVIYMGNNGTWTVTGLTNEVLYYYAAYAYDEVPNYATSTIVSAMPLSKTPKRIKTINITDTSAVIAWVTDSMVTGWVNYGTSSNLMNNRAIDIRTDGSKTTDYVHYVEITGLVASSLYWYQIVSGEIVYNQGTFNTGSSQGTITPSHIFSGRVYQSNGQTAYYPIIYVTLNDANGTGSTGESSQWSALASNAGTWTIDLSQIRTIENGAYFEYSPEGGDLILLSADDGIGGTSSTKVNTGTDSSEMVLNYSSPPDNVEDLQIITGESEIELRWTLPADPTCTGVLILQKENNSIDEIPQDTKVYMQNETIGDALVIYSERGYNCINRGLINGQRYWYRVFSYDMGMNYSSGIMKNGVPLPATPNVIVYPNPSYRGKPVNFIGLSKGCEIRIFTVAGELVKTIVDDDSDSRAEWNLTNEEGYKVASGLYLYQIKSPQTKDITGKLSVIK